MILTFDSTDSLFNGFLREMFGSIDYLIYSLISWILEGIFNLSSLAANKSFVQILYKRIYLVLAIFMVFKLTVSFIQYLVNPDAMTDKEKGVGKLIARTITMLVMLIALPILFFENMPGKDDTVLNVLQAGVIKTIPKIVLGIDSTGDANNSNGINASEFGQYMAVMMLRSFYYPHECTEDGAGCDLIESDNIDNLNAFLSSLKIEDGKVYKFHYMWPLTTISGVLLVVILLGLAIDVAIRVFKMTLLQMIAPVPIMSYIDPKSSKDGAFASWMKQFTTTYVEIFLKLTVIYMLLLLISKLFKTGEGGLFGESLGNIKGFMPKTFVYVFLTIGLFKFVKDAPKFIKDALGIKDNGGGGGFMGKMASGLAGAAAGFAGGGLAGAVTGAKAGYAASGTGKPANAYASARDAKAKALGRPEGGLAGRLNQAGLRSTVKRKTGLDKNTLAAAKQNMYDTQAEADEYAGYLEQARNNMQANGQSFYIDKNGHKVNLTKPGFSRLTADAAAKQTTAAKAKSKYDDAAQIAKSVGIKKGFMDDPENQSHGIIHRTMSSAHESEREHRYQGHWGSDIVPDKEAVSSERADLDVARQDRRGGFAEGLSGETVREAKDNLRSAKDQLKTDKETFRN